MVLNASKSDIQSAPAQTILNTQGVYAKKAANRRAQTLTSQQLDPEKYSATRRRNYTTGGKYIGGA
jgi:hypothetical protein